MDKKIVTFSNVPLVDDPTIEEAMALIAEEMDAQILIDSPDISNAAPTPFIVLCSGVNVGDASLLEKIRLRYQAGLHVVLYKPTNQEINIMYRHLEGRDYFSTETKVSGYTMFGLKRSGGVSYVLENHESKPENIARSMADFLEDKLELSPEQQALLLGNAQNAFDQHYSEKVNLAETAQKYFYHESFTLGGKAMALSFFMVSCHAFECESSNDGEDWHFIQQHGILNGENGYSKYWAGTRVKVNDKSWYVGEGEVCLNYVDYYQMTNTPNFTSDQDDEENSIRLVYAEPQAINGETKHTISESISLSGSIGFEAGLDSSGGTGKGSGSLAMGAGFDSSYEFTVQDCSCRGISLSEGTASAGWQYTFKRASQNRSAGKWQRLHDPAELSKSVFSPTNSWVWVIPTKNRDSYKSFTSQFKIGVMNTISRYSGSQSPKHIPQVLQKDTISFDVTLHLPPLLVVEQHELLFSKDAGTKKIHIASHGGWKVEKPAGVDWMRVSPESSPSEQSIIRVTVDQLSSGTERSTTFKLLRIKGTQADGDVATDESIEIQVFQSHGNV